VNCYKSDPFIETYSGKEFRPQDPRWQDVDIMDIAHALSNKCRYSGHTSSFYSVAQHSVIVSLLVPSEFAMTALLHDAAEAYFPDIPYPLRNIMEPLEWIEDGIHKAIAKRFNLTYPWAEEIEDVDRNITADEAWNLMHTKGLDWPGKRTRKGLVIHAEPPEVAKKAFIARYGELLILHPVDDPWHFKAVSRERNKRGEHTDATVGRSI